MARRRPAGEGYALNRSTLLATQRVYVIARTGSSRPSLMHLLPPGVGSVTACGIDVSNWSRAYTNQPIEQVLCLRGACRE